ncbi:MAG: helicase-exonuclease AddAB subunit AddA [Peptococcaceae bacterium]|jgi:ATP-dependent helicase/nuclease subunit A|nr:helicase-exonuclease AddAB subunit AddA [Peptococcaceae bacterium]MDH7524840.1 helicase-exonuclease AddAB subunit AddA [Peptococcaceae bacterium]
MVNWTPEQETAITARGRNLLVSAAAGAGKTAVLVERIIRRVLDPVDPVDIDRLLVVTFTNAAAQEMKERIAGALAARSREKPQDKNLQRQLLLVGRASISTLHSFCLDMIRQNYYRLSLPEGLVLDPRFRVAGDVEAALIKLETLESLFEDRYAAEDSRFLELVECFGGERDDRVLQELVLKLYDFSRSQPDPSSWLRKATAAFRSNLDDQAIQALFSQVKESIILPLEEAVEKLKDAAALAARPGGPGVYCQDLEMESEMLQRLLLMFSELSWQDCLRALGEVRFASLKPCRDKNVAEELKNETTTLRSEAKEIIKKLQTVFLARTPQEYIEDMWKIAPLMDSLCLLVEDYSRLYLKAKLERNVIDFADLEHFAINLLSVEEKEGHHRSELAEKLRDRYVEILVDEYQDINSVQETILKLVSREELPGNMFMVGDVKQSIYRFRLAEPGLFLARYREYGGLPAGQRFPGRRIALSRNFRSRDFIINGVNYLFRQIMSAKLGGIDYGADAELVQGASYPEYPAEAGSVLPGMIEVHIVNRRAEALAEPGEEEDRQEAEAQADREGEEELDTVQYEARIAGRRILELVKRQVWDGEMKAYRPVRFRDIVVLMRSTKNAGEVFIEELRRLGIPVYAETGAGYLEVQEIKTMLSLLKIIDNPRQDIPLAAVLRSPIVGLTAEELACIRMGMPRADFYNAVCLAARREKGELGEKLRRFMRRLRRWRTFSRRKSLVELIWLLFRETGYYDCAGAMPGGSQRQANLRALYDRAKQYEETTMKGLSRFLRFMEKLEETSQDLGTARPLGEKEEVVRIMSIHKSKGLEFPIVILAGLGRRFNFRDLREDILVDRDLGLGPVIVDYEKRLKYPTLARIAVRNRLKNELLAEEARILYVALTRAREGLVLVGTVDGLAGKLRKWRRVTRLKGWEFTPGIQVGANCFLDWLGPALLRHKDGRALLEAAGIAGNGENKEDPSRWQITVWHQQAAPGREKAAEKKDREKLARVAALLPVEGTGGYRQAVSDRLGWRYQYAALSSIPAKLSVTEIKHRFHQANEDEMSGSTFSRQCDFSRRPVFLQEEKGLSAAEKGAAFHLVMGHLDLSQSLTEENIREQVGLLVKKEIITPAQGNSISCRAIEMFFRSSLGKRLAGSPQIMRETPFIMLLPAGEALGIKGVPAGEKILVQGTIDCLFAEGDDYVLLDYKTDLVTRETREMFIERYRMQLDLYGRAVEAVFGKPVRERILYSVALGEAIVL